MFIDKIILTDHTFLSDIEIEFSQPDGKTIGSGINYVVGPSGAGKTKFLQTFLPASVSPPPTSWRSNHRIDASRYKVKIFDSTGFEIKQVGGLPQMMNFKEINPDSLKTISKYLLFNSEEYSEENPFGKIETKYRAKNRFNDDYPKTFQNSGSGEARFNILMSLMEAFKNHPKLQIALIEEPETFLDPITQLMVLEELGKISMHKQIFISTHSPYMISWDYLENGCSIIKTNRVDNETGIGKFCDASVIGKINNPGRRNPQLNGIETKNIFFSNKVFVVEGQEDVGLIAKYLSGKNYDFTFFGYGAGSSSRIENILKMCRDLKIHRVVALFDNNPKSSNHDYEKCKKAFPEFKIECLIAEDIRDKYVEKAVIKPGVFDFNPKTEVCTLKTNELGKDFESKIESILQYFSN